jgi:hypothetical protein
VVEKLPRSLACVRCGAPFVPRNRGRTRRYCAVPCRRAAEYEVRRVRRRLARQERELARRVELDRVNGGLLRDLRGLDGSTWAGDTDAIRVEVLCLRRRLHLLHPPRAAKSGRKEFDP